MASVDEWNVEDWLEKMGLPQYTEAFLDNGYDDFELCAALKPEELDAMGVEDQLHRAELFVQAEKLQQLTSSSGKNKTDNKPPQVQTVASAAPAYTEPWSSYSEPWSSDTPVKANGVALQVDTKSHEHGVVHRQATSEKPVPKKPKFAPASPAAKLPASQAGGAGGGQLTSLQLKLKIRQELQKDAIVLSDHQYAREDGTANEDKLTSLAEDYAGRFKLESLGVYDALLDIWKHMTSHLDSLTSPPPTVIEETDIGQQKVGATAEALSTNYDEPFDTANPLSQALQQKQPPGVPQGSPSPSKSHTLPPSGFKDYDEPFDTMTPGANPPPKKISVTKPESSTLPSPVTRRAAGPPEKAKKKDKKKSLDESKRSPKTSPKSGFKLFGKSRKEKKRSQSSLDPEDRQCPVPPSSPSNQPSKQTKKKRWGRSKDDTAMTKNACQVEEVDPKSVRASMGVFTFANGEGTPPPLPPRLYPGANANANASDSTSQSTSGSETPSPRPMNKYGLNYKTTPLESWNKDPLSSNGSLSEHEAKDSVGRLRLAKVMTGSDIELHRQSRLGEEEEDDSRGLRTSKSYDDLTFKATFLSNEKKKHKQSGGGIISRLFRRKTTREPSPTSWSLRNKPKPHSNCSSVTSEVHINESASLTSSTSMPDFMGMKVPPGKGVRGTASSSSSSSGQHTGTAHTRHTPPPKGRSVSGLETIGPRDITKGKETLKLSPKHPRVGKTSLSTSPDPDISPLLHRKIFIRGSSDSSTTDHVIIPIQSAAASEGPLAGKDTGIHLEDLHSPEPDQKFSDSDDSQGGAVFEADIQAAKGAISGSNTKAGSPQKRRSAPSVPSTIDRELTSSLTKKPPPPPKPRSLSKSSSPPSLRGGPASTLPAAMSPQTPIIEQEADKAQTLPVAKARTTHHPQAPPSKPVRQRSTTEMKEEGFSAPPKPVRRSLIEQGSKAPTTTQSSNVPPPKPATLRRKRKVGNQGGVEDVSNEPSRASPAAQTPPPKPVKKSVEGTQPSPQPPEEEEKEKRDTSPPKPSPANQPPPPKPQRYKSVKLIDPSSLPHPSPPPEPKSKTLPSSSLARASTQREKTESQRALSNSSGSFSSEKPKPLPKPRSLSKSSPPSSVKKPAAAAAAVVASR